MRFLTPLLIACTGAPSSAPEPTPDPKPEAPAPAPPPAPAPTADDVSKDTDISGMSEEERQAFLMKLGEKVYTTGDGGIACVTCHMANGQGMKGAFPPLVGQKDFMGDCKNHAGLIINGLNGEIEVDGVKYNGVMVPQGDALNDLQIAAAISFVRNSWGNDYGYCSPEDVKAARGG
ncbi:MAG TPA: cytochrome c [Deltaproteobacteria bacterium]|nr:cytochrome c [Deltaproteobacteria bacterium]